MICQIMKQRQANFLYAVMLCLIGAMPTVCAFAADLQAVFVGADACKECHQDEYSSFVTYAKKSRSYESIERLKTRLTPSEIKKCYSCHTTGYGKPGGFISAEETPHLKNAGCEVCHGPGSLHIKSAQPEDIIKNVTTEVCEVCHISERVKAFRYKPMIHGGAH